MSSLDEADHRRWLLSELVGAVERLGDSADDQIAYLRRQGSPPSIDELALELDDVAEAAISAPGLVTIEQARLVRDLDRALEAMSGPDHVPLWTEEALNCAPEWAHVRQLATVALEALRR